MDLSLIKRFFSGSDFLRPNRYRVEFHTKFSKPTDTDSKITESMSKVQEIYSSFTNEMSLLCKSVSFPFYTFNTIDSFVNNKNNSVIEKIDFDPVTFTFYVDAEKKILNFIRDWKNVIIDENFRYGYKDDYVTDITITMLHLHDSETASCTLINAFLVNVDSIELSADSRDSISEVSFSVQYDSIDYNTNIYDPRSFLKYFSGISHITEYQDKTMADFI